MRPYDTTSDRLLPHDKDAECAVLGIILTSGAIPPEAECLRPSDFYVQLHARTWVAMKQVAEGVPLDIISVKRSLMHIDTSLSEERVSAQLGSYIDTHGLPSSIQYYVQVIRDMADRRTIIETIHRISTAANDTSLPESELVAATESGIERLGQLGSAVTGTGFQLRFWDLSASAIEEEKALDWLVEPFLAETDVIGLVGNGGVGKSKLAAQAALAVAFGKPLFGQFAVKRPGRVVYLNEECPSITRRHLRSLATAMGIDPPLIADRVKLVGRGAKTWRVTDPMARKALIREIKAMEDVALVIWDSLHMLHDKEENENPQMTHVIELFRQICAEVGCCGLIIHHTGKGQQGQSPSTARGASAIRDTLDGLFIIWRRHEHDHSELRISHDKTRRVLLDPFLLRFEHSPQGDILAVNFAGETKNRVDQVLDAVLEVIKRTSVPLKSGEIALKLASKHRRADVYAALKVIRTKALSPCRKGPRGVFEYGGSRETPKE